MKANLGAVAYLLIFLSSANGVQAIQYRIVDLGFGIASDVNDRGQVAGCWRASPDAPVCACIWENGNPSDLGISGGGSYGNAAYGINEIGQVVGTTSTLGQGRAFLWDNGAVTDLGILPGCTFAWAVDVNNRGQVVGNCYANGGHTYAFLWQNGVMRGLGSGGTDICASAINDKGQIVGSYDTPWPGLYDHAFLWDNGILTDLGTLTPGGVSWAYGMNDNGQVVGLADTYWYGWQAFIWQDGVMSTLRPELVAGNANALDINNRGQVVGDFSYRSGDRAFLWQKGEPTVYLGILPGAYASTAFAISDSGLIAGRSETIAGPRAVLWVPGPRRVDLDIRPGTYPNSINIGSKGIVQVAAITANGFDATTIDPTTVRFAGAGPASWHEEDIEQDGDPDAVFHFRTETLDLTSASTVAVLTALTLEREPIEGTDSVNIVPQSQR